ncbi:hypothetical protein CC85DRAFT_202078 [Cutaneotrichosporon oleaginosum]|uniref:Uncharacterized protein n=1 Tax=Cutaneotrichosporon oleaginosum TaxID=879819 RepID=A0A0J0XUF5_9TREE|nr:uncharacterized protein CC85DRAFT_202078 [Cutaneotrichosporon oleaginosum]KLT44700.1 hypothetical protein CC85DRAFT_202078 [Cutaneotrichosporon oleaginosum]TXT07685.1 hypothetical protein COLE_04609 [Cutaneotrichosporon oleaginosum]
MQRPSCSFIRDYSIPGLTVTFHYRSKERLQHIGIIPAPHEIPDPADTQRKPLNLASRKRKASSEETIREDKKPKIGAATRKEASETVTRSVEPQDDDDEVIASSANPAADDEPEIIDLTKEPDDLEPETVDLTR